MVNSRVSSRESTTWRPMCLMLRGRPPPPGPPARSGPRTSRTRGDPPTTSFAILAPSRPKQKLAPSLAEILPRNNRFL